MEKRHHEGLPEKTIQLSAVGEIEIVVKLQEYSNEMEVVGTLMQRISSFLKVFDKL